MRQQSIHLRVAMSQVGPVSSSCPGNDKSSADVDPFAISIEHRSPQIKLLMSPRYFFGCPLLLELALIFTASFTHTLARRCLGLFCLIVFLLRLRGSFRSCGRKTLIAIN